MKIPVPNGGGSGSGSGSTECTATAEDVLETKTAIYNGSGDEPEYGSMKNVASIDPAKSITITSGVLYARMTHGAHVQDASSGYPEVSVPQADLASAAGLTAAKIATGNSILGITGTYTGVGTAGTSQVLSGYTFSSASLSGASGAMSNRSGTTTSATASLDSSNNRVRMQVPNTGYYNTSSYLYTSYASMASVIGLTAAKIAEGNTILGIDGTAPTFQDGDYVDLFNNGTIYPGVSFRESFLDEGSVGDTIHFITNYYQTNMKGMWCNIPIDLRKFKTITITYVSSSSTSNGRLAIGISDIGNPVPEGSEGSSWSKCGYKSSVTSGTAVTVEEKGEGYYLYFGENDAYRCEYAVSRIRLTM